MFTQPWWWWLGMVVGVTEVVIGARFAIVGFRRLRRLKP
jgi:hypothetical protein